MAGEATVPAQHYPDEFDVFHLAHAHSALEAPTQLIFAERGYVIDCIIVGIPQAGGSGTWLTVEPVSANQLRCSIRVRYRSRFK